MLLRLVVSVAFALNALPAFAQTVAFDDPWVWSDAPQLPNQWDTASDAVKALAQECQLDSVPAPPYLHMRSPNGDIWKKFANDTIADPGDAFVFASDPCGLRTENLSGVYASDERQYIVTHDPRTGRFEVRFLYISPKTEPRLTWKIGLGWLAMEGRIHRDEIWMNMYGIFPPNFQARCPDQYQTVRKAVVTNLSYQADEDGNKQTVLEIHFPRLRISSDCNVTFMEKNTSILKFVELIP